MEIESSQVAARDAFGFELCLEGLIVIPFSL
jgi:hypothetical protein